MPYVAGPLSTNFVAYNLDEDNDDLSAGFPVLLAQCFPVTETKVVSTISCLINPTMGIFHSYLGLHSLDGEGKPLYPPLYISGYGNVDRYIPVPVRWARYKLPSNCFLPAGQYAIVLDFDKPHLYPNGTWRADSIPPLYAGGKAWRSVDNGYIWNELTDYRFLFKVWGYSPPPDTPPPLEIGNWAPIDKTEVSLLEGFKITVTTDRPCHLFMRWSHEQPLTHPAVRFERGVRLMSGLRYCFVAFHENEQLELGDTLLHTFEKRNWPVCETRWFYFIGSVQDEEMPSSSPIFHLHRTEEYIASTFGPSAGSLSNRHIQQTNVNWTMVHNAPSGTIPATYDLPWAQLTAGESLTASYWLYRAFLSFDTSAIPAGSQILSAQLAIFVQANYRTSSAAFPYCCITQGVQDDPVIPTNYGAQWGETDVGGTKDFVTFVPLEYNDIDFNALGLGFIVPGGVTKLCLRGQQDVEDRPPPLGSNRVVFNSTQKGEGYQPRLTVNYIPP